MATTYTVQFTITVDHPEQRGASYKPVPRGHKIPEAISVLTYKRALALYTELISGESDTAAEYVSSAQVILNPRKGCRRTAPRGHLVYRARDADTGKCRIIETWKGGERVQVA